MDAPQHGLCAAASPMLSCERLWKVFGPKAHSVVGTPLETKSRDELLAEERDLALYCVHEAVDLAAMRVGQLHRLPDDLRHRSRAERLDEVLAVPLGV